MDQQLLIDQVLGLSSDHQTIQAARVLASCTDDSQVVDALCKAAVCTTRHEVREALLEVLKVNPADACKRFADVALWSPTPSCRKWALINLSLMGCNTAKNAVISGLHDPDASVRRAAAMSTGLYDDKDVLDEQERYFERHRFGLTLSFIGEGIATLKNKADRLDDDTYAGDAVDALGPNA